MEKPLHEGYLASDVEALKRSISNNLRYRSGKIPLTATRGDWLLAAELAVRNRLVERWMKSNTAYYTQNSKVVYYLSMEFLIGRTFQNALECLDIREDMEEALRDLAVDMEEITSYEPDAALGNGGLGRLAACFLDAMATLNIANIGYGIRYDYGMFKQEIIDGYQVETPDYWLLTRGNPWEFPRPELQFNVGMRPCRTAKWPGTLGGFPSRSGDGVRYHYPGVRHGMCNDLAPVVSQGDIGNQPVGIQQGQLCRSR